VSNFCNNYKESKGV